MTIADLIKNKDYDYITLRVTLPERCGGGDTLMGIAKSENGELIALDDDTYNEQEIVLHYEEWVDLEKGIENGLTVVLYTKWR